MDGQPAQQENPAIPARSPGNPFNRKTFIYVIILLLVFFLGLISSSVLPFGKLTSSPPQAGKVATPSPLSQKPAIEESKLPISFALLTNPIVYEWRGSVKGKITQKDDEKFTLTDEQSNSIIITKKMPSGDVFKARFFDKVKNKQISLQDIPLGTNLLGDFFIFKGAPNTPVGSNFITQ